jgi:hypothetical protein
MDDPEARRAGRAAWSSRVVRHPFSREEAAADCAFFLQIPADERARITWELSRELFLVAGGAHGVAEMDDERRLPRSAFRVERR